LYLEGFNVVTKPVYYPMATEACKLLSNIHMGVEIAWRQEAQRILDGFGIDSKVYEEWEDTYNMGYRITGDEQLTRPRLRPDPIGGHCILQCTEILSAQYPSHIFDFIKESNEKAKRHLTETARETVNA
jgi:UDP-N-acetyl-D-mannosaminuronate dehydrogenase